MQALSSYTIIIIDLCYVCPRHLLPLIFSCLHVSILILLMYQWVTMYMYVLDVGNYRLTLNVVLTFYTLEVSWYV